MTPEEKSAHNRVDYQRRRALDPTWAEKRKQQSAEYRKRKRGPTKIEKAIAAEREACARLAEDGLWIIDASHAEGKTLVYSREIAAGIRARK